MEPWLPALIGLPVGFALDALAGKLATSAEEAGPPGEADAPPRERTWGAGTAARAYGGEAGVLVLPAAHPGIAWARRSVLACATSALFAAAAARYDDVSHVAIVAAYLCALIVCATTDALAYRVPNVVTYPAIVAALIVGARMPGAGITEALAGGALAGGVLLVPALLSGGAAMGMGDVKLAAFAGLALGFEHVVPAMLIMALGGGAAALLLLAAGRRKRGEPIPYAPFISAGAAAALLWQGSAFVSLA